MATGQYCQNYCPVLAEEEIQAVLSVVYCAGGSLHQDADTHKYHVKLLFFRQLKWDKMNPTQCDLNSEYLFKLSLQNGLINHNFFWINHTILLAI